MQDSHDAPRWERLKALFAEALEVEGDGRDEVLARAARENAELGRELAALLAAHARGGLMAAPTLPPETWGAAPDPGARTPPTHIGRYQVRALLGVGGMGEVWLAHDPLLDRDVALKLLPAGLSRRPQRRARLLREARAAASLNHPNITTIHEVGQADGRDYIAFEHVPGRTLRQRLAEGPLPLRELLDIAVPLADALAAAHERGVVHRDVKAANVMVSDRGSPKLLDFGLASSARAEDGDEPDDSPRSGTPAAMSPEQARGAPLDARTDVFSLGSLLHELAAGQPAFAGEDVAETLDAVLHREPPGLRDLRPELPRELAELVARMLSKDPARRPQRMAEVAAELRRLAQRGGAASAWRVTAAALAVLAVVATVVHLLTRGGGQQPPAPPVAGPRADLLAVMAFENPADPADAEQLGGMLARLLSSHLAAGDGLQVLSPQRLHDVARLAGLPDGRVDRASASDVARRADVATMIIGQVGPVAGGLLATAEVIEVASGRTLLSPRARGAGPQDLFSMAESLNRQVREGLREPVMTQDERDALAGQLTTSLEAFRAYVRGLEALLQDNPQEAAEALREATRIDPAFALAQLRLGLACVWSGDNACSELAFERALAFRDKLPPELQLMLDALRPYYLRDDTRTALPLLEQVLERDPYEHDALYMLGEIFTHSATRSDPARAAEMFGRMLALDPGLTLVYEHLLTALLRGGRPDAARAQLQAWRARPPQNLAELEGTLALWEGRFADAARGLRDPLAAAFLAGSADAPSLRALLDAGFDGQVASASAVQGVYRVQALDLRASILVAHGRCAEAARLYELAASEPTPFLSVDGFMTSSLNAARQHLAQLRAATGDLAGARALAEEARSQQPDTWRAPYLAALFALRAGDDAAARAHLSTLQDLAGRGWGPSATLYRDALAAELDLYDGRAAAARAGFATLVASGRLLEDWYTCEDSLGPLVRDGLARACVADGDPAAAAEALAGLIDAGLERLRQPVPWVQAHATRGRLLLEAGRVDEGRALLERFLGFWGSADQEMPEVARVRALLGR